MDNYILEKYIKALETTKNKITGIYTHGSGTLGYLDKYSDLDYSVIWETNYPNKKQRITLLEKLNDTTSSYIGDQEHKGTDRFFYDNVEYNISHRLDFNFLNIYKEVQTLKVNEPKLYILGGFKRGKIIYDPNEKLKKYADEIKVTPEIVKLFKETRSQSTANNLKALQVAAEREQPIEFIKSLNYLLITFGIQLYLENRQFPISPKWLEKDADTFGWESPLLDILNELKTQNDFGKITEAISKVEETPSI